jgi:hypothetical protein
MPPQAVYSPRPQRRVVRDAQYDGWCYACSEHIDAGDRITPSDEGWVHEECGREEPAPSTRQMGDYHSAPEF